MSKPLFIKGRNIAAIATLVFAAFPSQTIRAWNSADIAIGSHPVAFYATDLDVDVSGNTVTTFQIHSPNGTETTDVEPGSGTKNLVTSNGSYDGVITKFSSTGSFDWAYHIRGTTNTSEVIPSKIRTDSQGNIYVVGIFKGAVEFGTRSYDFATSTFTSNGILTEFASNKYDGFVLKLNPSGVLQWVKRMVSVTQNSYSLYLDTLEIAADDSLYIGGTNYGAVDVDYASGTPQNEISYITNSGGYNVYIAKFNNSGSFQWSYSNLASSVTDVDVVGTKLLATGIFNDTVNFDPASSAPGSLTDPGSGDIYIVELTTSGSFQRVQHIKGRHLADSMNGTFPQVKIASDGSIYASGVNYGVTYAPSGIYFSGASNSNLVSFVGATYSANGYVVKYASDFTFQWASMFLPATPYTGASPQQVVNISKIDLTSDGGLAIGGQYYGKVDLDPSNSVVDAKTNAATSPGTDAFLMKLNSSGGREWVNILSNSSAKSIASIVVKQGYITTYGTFGGTLDFDPSGATYNVTASSTSAFIWRVDSTGQAAPAALPASNTNSGGSNTSGSGTNTSGGSTAASGSVTSSYPSSNEISSFKAVTLVEDGNVQAGQSFDVTASGFTASENVNAYLVGSTSSLGVSKASANGTAKVKVTIPRTTSGKKTLLLFGSTSRHGVKQSLTVQKAVSSSTLPSTGAQSQFLFWIAVVAICGGVSIRRLRRI